MSFRRTLLSLTVHPRPPCRVHILHAHRHPRFSTSATLAINFTKEESWDSARKLAETFRDNVWRSISAGRCLPEVHKTYQTLRQQVERLGAKDPHAALYLTRIMSPSDWNDVLETFAQYGSTQDITNLESILLDMSAIFSRIVSAETHSTILRSLLKRSDSMLALSWLSKMHRKPGMMAPTLDHWCLILKEYESRELYDHMWKTFALMENLQVRHHKLYTYLLRAVFKTPQGQMKQVTRLIDCMATGRLPFHNENLAVIVDGFTSQGQYDKADSAEDYYRSHVGRRPDIQPYKSDNRDRLLADSFRTEGRKKATKLYDSFLERGWRPTHSTLLSLLRCTYNPDDLIYWENLFQTPAGPEGWTILVRNSATARQNVTLTARIYGLALQANIPHSFTMVEPVIRELCSSLLRSPDEKRLDLALKLYHAVSRATVSTKTDSSSFRAPEVVVYNTLLRALISSTNHAKYFPHAMTIFEDLRKRNVPLDNMAITSLVILAMKSSESYADAYEVYKHLLSCFKGQFDGRSFTDILIAFGRLRFRGRTLPPWRVYFNIVQDMRNAGFPTTQYIYTEILHQLARVAHQIVPAEESELYTELLRAIKDTHHYLVMDPFITPDTACLNQLMDTYQRAGMWTEARQVWDSMYFAGTIDSTSINIFLDACGHLSSPAAAREIFDKLHQDGFKFSTKNWQAWVECLCRLGEMEEATKLVLLEMAKGNPEYKPDVECLRIIHKFSREHPMAVSVQERVRQYYPDFAQTLTHDVFEY